MAQVSTTFQSLETETHEVWGEQGIILFSSSVSQEENEKTRIFMCFSLDSI